MSPDTVVTVIALVVGVALSGVGGFFTIKASKVKAEDDTSVTTVTMLSGQIAALTSAQELARSEIAHLRELVTEKDRTLERNARDIERLQGALTQRAAVEAFRKESRLWFRAIALKVGAEEPQIIGED